MAKKNNNFSEEHKRSFVAEVDKLRSEGMSLQIACRTAKGSHNPLTYKIWKKNLGADAAVVLHSATPAKRRYNKKKVIVEKVEQAGERVIMLLGNASEILKVMRGL